MNSNDHSLAKVNDSCGTIECQISFSLCRNNNFAQARRYHAGNPIVTDRAKQYQLSNQFEFLLIFWLYAINSHNSLKSLFLSSAFHNFVSGNFSSFSFSIKSIVDKTCSEIDLLSRTLRRFESKIRSEALRWKRNHFSHSTPLNLITIRMLTTFVALVSLSLRRRVVSYEAFEKLTLIKSIYINKGRIADLSCLDFT